MGLLLLNTSDSLNYQSATKVRTWDHLSAIYLQVNAIFYQNPIDYGIIIIGLI